MTIGRSVRVFLFSVIVTGSPYQTWIAWAGASEHSDALVLYPGATEVSSGKRGGTDQLTYHVKERLPASGVIDWISAELWRQKWKPLPYDVMQPDNASAGSQLRGWHPFIDATGSTQQCVQQWSGYWKDSSGNVVLYMFRYKLAEDCAPDSDDLEVFATYIPAPLVKQGQEDFKKYKQEHNAP